MPQLLVDPAGQERGDLRIDVPDHHAGTLVALREHDSPRIDEHAVTIRAPAVVVQSTLRRSEYVALVLDRPRPEQHMPVRSTGHGREGGGNDDQRKVVKASIELRKPQVVAHR